MYIYTKYVHTVFHATPAFYVSSFYTQQNSIFARRGGELWKHERAEELLYDGAGEAFFFFFFVSIILSPLFLSPNIMWSPAVEIGDTVFGYYFFVHRLCLFLRYHMCAFSSHRHILETPLDG